MSNNYSNNTNSNSSSNSSSNRINVPEAKFKMLTRQRGRRPRQGQMVKKMCPVGRARFDRQSRTSVGHCPAGGVHSRNHDLSDILSVSYRI